MNLPWDKIKPINRSDYDLNNHTAQQKVVVGWAINRWHTIVVSQSLDFRLMNSLLICVFIHLIAQKSCRPNLVRASSQTRHNKGRCKWCCILTWHTILGGQKLRFLPRNGLPNSLFIHLTTKRPNSIHVGWKCNPIDRNNQPRTLQVEFNNNMRHLSSSIWGSVCICDVICEESL